jgi:hypothetical protein
MTGPAIAYTEYTINATQTWQDTEVNVATGVAVTINAMSGVWTANPDSNGGALYGANGAPGLIVAANKTSYPLVGAQEGALIGRFGDAGIPFFIGDSNFTVNTSTAGNLQLVINDDLTGQYGAGLADNVGSINFIIDGADKVMPLSSAEQTLVNTINTTWTSEQALSELQSHLQVAVEVELATLPLYLYTYYSINRTPTDFPTTAISQFADKAGGIVMSVAVEEMLHMSLASNILYSLGQQPELYLNSPNFPSNLPGHAVLGPDSKPMLLPLAKFSVDQLWKFLEVEYPANSDAPPEGSNWETIGQIYSYVRCIIHSNFISDANFKAGLSNQQIQSDNYSPNNIDTVYPDASFNKSCPVPTSAAGSAATTAVYPSEDDSHAGAVELLTVDSCVTALQAIQTIDAQGEGFGPNKFDDPSQMEFSHYYKFLTLQSQLAGYETADPILPAIPARPPAAAPQYTAEQLKAVVFEFPDNPKSDGYPASRKAVADVVSGLYQYMLIMTESIYKHPPQDQKKYFNQSLHRSMIWILDKVIQAMRQVTLNGDTDGVSLAPTFENYNLGPRDQAFGNLCTMSNNLIAAYKDEKWFSTDIMYYIQMVETLPDVSQLWTTVPPSATYTPPVDPVQSGPVAGTAQATTVSGGRPNCDLTPYAGIPKFPATPPANANGDRHACMGLNSCENQGRTGVNDCAGQGYCSTALAYNYKDPSQPTVGDHTCHVNNNCAAQGGCGLYGTAEEQNNPGANDCATLGSCATPINAERFGTEGPNRGKSVWARARTVFEEKTWPKLQANNNALPPLGPVPHANVFQYGPTIEWIEGYSGQGMTACGSSGMSGAGSCA